ncbi:MAG: hypothetical protein Q9185_005751 [Variospora sp. 1 TL-2023]
MSNAPYFWSFDPDDLNEARDEFVDAVSMLTGRQWDPRKPVEPILHIRDGSPGHLVEYPAGTKDYYFWNLISGEVWKIRRPTKLADILESFKDYYRANLDMVSLDPDGGTKSVKVDIPQAH